MSLVTSKKAKVTPETLAEAKVLFEIWNRTAHPSQAAFGEMYGVGNQSAVGQFLRGDVPLSLKAAQGFSKGLGCKIEDFSPRLAAKVSEAQQLTNLVETPNQIVQLTTLVNRLTSSGKMHLNEVEAMIALLKAREG